MPDSLWFRGQRAECAPTAYAGMRWLRHPTSFRREGLRRTTARQVPQSARGPAPWCRGREW